MKVLTSMILLFLVAGCASVPEYIRPDGVSEESQRRDTYQCELEAKQATQASLANPRYSIVTTMILQSHQVRDLMNTCMLSKGYLLQESGGSDSVTIPPSGPTAGPTSHTSEDDFVQSPYFRLAKQYVQLAALGKEGALDQVEALAEEGDIEWQVFLGAFYLMGQQAPLNRTEYLNLMRRVNEGNPHDLEQAFNWFQRAATQGDSWAQSLVGIMYGSGLGVRKDLKQSAHWFLQAAQQGDATAQASLGYLYMIGQGVPQDYIQAHMWLNLAAAQGSEEALKLRDQLSTKMTPAQLAEAQRLAREWKPRGWKPRPPGMDPARPASDDQE